MNKDQYLNLDESLSIPGTIHSTAKLGKNLIIGLNVIVEDGVVIGDNCFLGHNVVVRENAKIGNNVVIRIGCLIDPDVVIGNDVSVFPHAILGGGTVVEDKVYFGPKSVSTNVNEFAFHRRGIDKKITGPLIKTGAVIGTGCEIKSGVTIGRNSLLGFGSVLTTDIQDNEVWFGNPARLRRSVKPREMVILTEEMEANWPYSIEDLTYLKENIIR